MLTRQLVRLAGVTDHRGRGRPVHPLEPKALKGVAAVGERAVEQTAALQAQGVEEHQVHRSRRDEPGGLRRGDTHPRLEPLDVGAALRVESDDLPVEHGRHPGEDVGQGMELGAYGRHRSTRS
ncbi:hypothetical protein OG897_40535 [Streptomyces sp. NBC_00237]|nr:hypothetical protein [Streptomyces sp. NBC_00237]MCX5207673.1 hypothetical protein [Streptomyces sp. NBC_00237]